MPLPTAAGNFELAKDDAAFGARKKDIFATLDTIEAKHLAFENTKSANNAPILKPDPTDDELFALSKNKSAPSTFKVPTATSGLTRKRKAESESAPGLKSNLGKWKRYDLSDVPADQLSEKQNSAAAFDFLNSLKPSSTVSGGSEASGSNDSTESSGKHLFKKPSKGKDAKDCLLVNSKPPPPVQLFGQTSTTSETPDAESDSDESETYPEIIPKRNMPDVVPKTSEIGEVMEVDSISGGLFRSAKNLRCRERHVRNKDDSDEDSDDDLEISSSTKLQNSEALGEASSDDDSDDFAEYAKPSDDEDEIEDDGEMVDGCLDTEEFRSLPCVLRSDVKNDELDLDEVD